jgi:hypothetical protein
MKGQSERRRRHQIVPNNDAEIARRILGFIKKLELLLVLLWINLPKQLIGFGEAGPPYPAASRLKHWSGILNQMVARREKERLQWKCHPKPPWYSPLRRAIRRRSRR